MHIREPAVDAVVAEGELGVIDAEQVQDRGAAATGADAGR